MEVRYREKGFTVSATRLAKKDPYASRASEVLLDWPTSLGMSDRECLPVKRHSIMPFARYENF